MNYFLSFYHFALCGCGYPPSCTRSKLERPGVVFLFVLGVWLWYDMIQYENTTKSSDKYGPFSRDTDLFPPSLQIG